MLPAFPAQFLLNRKNRFGDGFEPGLRYRLAAQVGKAVAAFLDLLQRTGDMAQSPLVDVVQRLVNLVLLHVLRLVFGIARLLAILLLESARIGNGASLGSQQLITQRFEAVDKVARIGSPLLVVHGDEDSLIRSELGRKLYDAARGRKRFVLVEGGSHFSTMTVGMARYREALAQVFSLQ